MLENIIGFLVDTAFYAYLLVFALGLAWVAIGLLLGGLESMVEFAQDMAGSFDGDADSWGHQQVGLSPFSPLMIAVFGMLFGVTGMALQAYTSIGAGWVLLATASSAVALDAAFYVALTKFFVASQASSLPQATDAVGTVAVVATRIAPGMTGTINYEIAGRRQSSGARAADGGTYDAGDVVRIRSIQGSVASVAKE